MVIIVAETLLLIPFGFATGYLNMNLVELAEDANLPVKAEYYGLFNAVTQYGKINEGLLYEEAIIDIIGPLGIFGFITVVFGYVAKYNERKVKTQIDDLESIYELQMITEEAGIELWSIQTPNDNDPQMHVSEKLLSFLMIEELEDFTERDIYKYWF